MNCYFIFRENFKHRDKLMKVNYDYDIIDKIMFSEFALLLQLSYSARHFCPGPPCSGPPDEVFLLNGQQRVFVSFISALV